MQRLLAIAVLGAIALLPSGLEAQFRGAAGGMGGGFGGGRMGGGMGFAGGAARGAFVGPGFRPGFVGRGFGFGGVGFHHPRFGVFVGGCFGCRAGFARRRFFFPYSYPYYAYPAYYPPYGYGYGDYASPGYASSPTVVVQQPANSGASYENDQLTAEVRGLRDEVRQLREEQKAAQPQPSTPERRVTTVLVFRDGHRSEITNFAIVGQTLWIFNERKATKVLISDLNIPATRAANEERGVEFSVPQ